MKTSSAVNIRKSLIGSNHVFQGPFGPKPIVYADSTASNKAVSFIEDYIRDTVLPYYANTHTETSATGRQTTRLREDARDLVREALHAPVEEYAVVFTGSGATSAIFKLANVLGVSPLSEGKDERSVVFISQQEHHSNELIWRESKDVDLVVIPPDADTGSLSLTRLEEELRKYQDRAFKLGSFTAASNVTGMRCDTKEVTRLLHQYGAYAAWDFAAAGSHVDIDMVGEGLDAVYLSPHKYVGGPGTPGILTARQSLFRNRVPSVPGGGTVLYVQPHGHRYLDNIEHREEGGTPAIVESIRAGLVLQLHHQVGGDWIEKQEAEFLDRATSVWGKNPNLVILGSLKAKRVPIVSFLVKSPIASRPFVHHNFIVALLNDLFGIQTRGGCSCAGPYGHLLLSINNDKSDTIVREMERHGEALKPGWTRLSFSYYMSNETVDYIIAAVDLVARHGFRMMPWYRFDQQTAGWTHVKDDTKPMNLWDFSHLSSNTRTVVRKDLKGDLKHARDILENPPVAPTMAKVTALPESSQSLRWFPLPEEVHLQEELRKGHEIPLPRAHRRYFARRWFKMFRKNNNSERPKKEAGKECVSMIRTELEEGWIAAAARPNS